MELKAYEDGVLLKILVGEGESADLGAPIALIGAEDEEVAETAARENGPPRSGYTRGSRPSRRRGPSRANASRRSPSAPSRPAAHRQRSRRPAR